MTNCLNVLKFCLLNIVLPTVYGDTGQPDVIANNTSAHEADWFVSHFPPRVSNTLTPSLPI